MAKNQFLTWGKSLKLPEMQFHEKKERKKHSLEVNKQRFFSLTVDDAFSKDDCSKFLFE